MEQKYHMNFMKCDKYCFSRKKKFKKEKRNDDYDILFFNLLNIVKHSELDVFYNRKVEKGIKLNICQELDNIKFSKKDYLCELLSYENNIDLQTFNMLCFYFKINVIFLCENVYHKMYYNNNYNANYYILNKNKEIKCIKEEKIEILLQGKYEIMNITKPINSISYYKLDNIIKMYNDLGFEDTNEKWKKKEYYERCKSYLQNVLELK